MNAPPNAPTTCEHCGKSLTGVQWSIAHGTNGPQPFTQCQACWNLIYVDPPKPPAA
jgi:hypothetical protein